MIPVILLLLFCLGLCSCGPEKEVAPPPPKPAYLTISVPGRPRNPILADFDRDGVRELAVVAKSPWLYLFRGTEPWHRYDVSTHNTWLVALDLDRDGDLDLLPLTEALLGPVLRNDGQGNFVVEKKTLRGPKFGYHAASGDLDQDGFPDVVAVGLSEARVFVFWNQKGKSLSPQVLEPPAAKSYFGGEVGMREVHLVDWDGDGRLDLLIADYFGKRVLWGRNLGEKKFVFKELYRSPDEGTVVSVLATDLDGDGQKDLVVAVESIPRLLFFKRDGENLVLWEEKKLPRLWPRRIVPGKEGKWALFWLSPGGTRIELYQGRNLSQEIFLKEKRCEYGQLVAEGLWCTDLYHDELVFVPFSAFTKECPS